MKTLSIILALIFITTPVFANWEWADEINLGWKVDAPNLIKKGNHAIGVELSVNEINSDWINDGSQAFAKYTFSGSILNFDK